MELADGRLQGVVSSGSDLARVYVSFIQAGDCSFSCSTNNNRPCGGLRGSLCKHLDQLLAEAQKQFGAERLAQYLRLDPDAFTSGRGIAAAIYASRPQQADRAGAASVFSSFLRQLALLEVPAVTTAVPELDWFPATREAA